MYLSRYHFGNKLVSVAIDSLTGELLEFVNESNGENLIKNSEFSLHQPFWILADKSGAKIKLFGADVYQITRHPVLKPAISSQKSADGGITVTVRYQALTDGEDVYAVSASYTVCLPAGKSETVWRMKADNRENGLVVKQVHFPCINGVYLGETWEDDTLVYPYLAGVRIPDPVDVLSGPHQRVGWKWQEYRYYYERKNLAAGPDKDGLYAMECEYSGPLSMTWLDYYGGGTGFYFANHDPEPRIIGLRADTPGTGNPGMNFSVIHRPALAFGEHWTSPEAVAAVHAGDWHEGARRYRAFREKCLQITPRRPAWFDRSAGLIAHYDFKYQCGGVVHRYKDIPRLLDEAHDLGINHLLIAGWHRDGFDHGFPQYEPDGDLGTEEELHDAIGNIRKGGGHVCFYVNSRLANRKYAALEDFIRDNAILQEDGSVLTESYGNQDLTFAAMCINSPGWPEKLKGALRFATEKIGIDGVYLDQLAMAAPGHCSNGAHAHAPDCWNAGYQALLGDISSRYQQQEKGDMCIIHEGVSDSYGGLVSGQLISTFSYFHCGAFPEMYKYTFPEQILVDMLYPEKNMAMRPVHIGQISTQLINEAFLTGCYYWIYDLVDDNTFTRDPKQYEYLKNAVTLRNFWLSHFGQGLFRDTDSIRMQGGASGKRFDFGEDRLIACAARGTGAKCSVRMQDGGWETARSYFVDHGEVREEDVVCKRDGDTLVVALPDAPLSLLSISRRKQTK